MIDVCKMTECNHYRNHAHHGHCKIGNCRSFQKQIADEINRGVCELSEIEQFVLLDYNKIECINHRKDKLKKLNEL